jgi:ABC-2 type transport system permease protein
MIVVWIAQRVMREILRDRRTVAFFFLVPVAVMVLVYFALAKDEEVRLAVVYRGIAQSLAEPLEDALKGAEGVRRVDVPSLDAPTGGSRFFATVPEEPGLEENILDALKRGDADAVLFFPAALVQERFAGKPGTVMLYVEGSRPQLTTLARQAVIRAAARIAPAMNKVGAPYARGLALPPGTPAATQADQANSQSANAAGGALPELRVAYLHGSAGYRLVDFFLPTLLPFFVFFFTFMVSTITFQRERSRGTLERILIAPVGLVQVVLGYVLGFAGFALAQVAIVMGFVLALITFPVNIGQVTALIVLCVLLMVIALLIGLLVSFNARNEFQAVQFVPLIILPQIFLSDLIWTLDGFPAPFRWLAQVFPLTHANAITRGILLQGRSLTDLWPRLLALVAIAVAVLACLAWEGRRKGGAMP